MLEKGLLFCALIVFFTWETETCRLPETPMPGVSIEEWNRLREAQMNATRHNGGCAEAIRSSSEGVCSIYFTQIEILTGKCTMILRSSFCAYKGRHRGFSRSIYRPDSSCDRVTDRIGLERQQRLTNAEYMQLLRERTRDSSRLVLDNGRVRKCNIRKSVSVPVAGYCINLPNSSYACVAWRGDQTKTVFNHGSCAHLGR